MLKTQNSDFPARLAVRLVIWGYLVLGLMILSITMSDSDSNDETIQDEYNKRMNQSRERKCEDPIEFWHSQRYTEFEYRV
jgi:hypothetical protein